MSKFSASFIVLLCMMVNAKAQIVNGLDTLYGNEWIQFDQSYFKLKIGKDGIYRVGFSDLNNAGVPVSQVTGGQFQLWHNGEQVPIFATSPGIFGPTDYIEFFGKKNTSELDRYLFRSPDSMMMNPLYSLVTDTAAYFLTWVPSGGTNLRYQTIPNDLTNLPLKEDYYFASLVNNYTNSLQKYSIGQNISPSSYEQAEGYASAYANTKVFTITPTAIYPGGPDAELRLRFSGNPGPHQQAISLNGQLLATVEFEHFQVRNEVFPLSIGQVTGTMDVQFQGLFANSDLQRVSNIILRYPRQFDFENQASYAFEMSASNAVKYLEINNFDFSQGLPVLYDLTNQWRMLGQVEGNVVKFALPPSSTDRSLLLANDNTGVLATTLQPVSFINFGALDHDYIILTGKNLLNNSTPNQVQAYADYRASQAGGAFNPIMVEVEQLYDQFSWGIERHPFSIRNFGVFVKKQWSNPRYFFIIGKGREYPNLRASADLTAAINAGFSVPTYGWPASDNMLLAGPDGFTPVIPIGRIAATSQAQVGVYLEKVMDLEANKSLPQTLGDRAWMKRVLHMGGGIEATEQNSIKQYLRELETSIEQSKFGGEVKEYYKTSTDPIQVSVTEQLFNYINSGTSLITFFGHSSSGTFDFSIDDPDNFDNQGKYPLLLSLGCFSGYIHAQDPGISERFCFLKDKGAIAFAASTGQAYLGPLASLSTAFYNSIGEEAYGQGIGDAIRDAIASIPSGQYNWDNLRQQFTLHGDPAIGLNPAPGPDYVVDPAAVQFSPAQITTQMADFDLRFDVVNIGSHTAGDSIVVSIVHELPDGSKITPTELLIPAPPNRASLQVKLPTLGNVSKGFNRFYITVDKTDRAEELPSPAAEQNNELVTGNASGIGIYFSDNSIKAVYPPEFAIANKADLTLAASTVDPLMQVRSYIFQLDTTELFNSPSLINYKINEPGGTYKWKPNIDWKNNQVYYWRVSPDSLSPQEGFIWDNSSFVYLDIAESGWNQSHFFQWKKDLLKDMELKSHGNLKYIDNFKDVFLKNAVNTISAIDLKINSNFAGRFWYNTDAGMYAVVFDSTTATEWLNVPPSPYGVPLNVGSPVAAFTFDTKTLAGRQQLIEFLRDVVPSKNYVLLHTTQANLNSDYMPQDWESDQPTLGTDLFQTLEAQGAGLIRNTLTVGAVPYVFAYQKDVGPLKEVLADSLTQVLTASIAIPGYWDEGAVVSTPIGPASSWNKLAWNPVLSTNPETDTVSVDLLAYNPATATDSLLASKIQPGEFDLANVSATQFPFLKLRFNSKDAVFRTSPQLEYWRVLYEGVPEFAFHSNSGLQLLTPSINQGQPLLVRCSVENLSDYAASDSLLIKYLVRAENNSETVVYTQTKKMAANDTLSTRVDLDTKSFAGDYTLLVELNPDNDQPEQTHENNILTTSFNIAKDKRNPLLDVTFDGFHIMDGDLVSAKPLILMELADENPFLLLNDTNLFRVFLALPDTNLSLKRIYFNDPQIVFYPAQASNKNKAYIEFNPVFSEDGTYQLLVQAKDVSGNQSGDLDYKISFKIITKSTISNFLNYPNPFTTSTRFVYTMTGATPPARFKLQIMTITGNIVRELTQDDLGPLKVGTHQTEFAWDGTDAYGDRLAKGVYLYRMTAQDENGKAWENNENTADRYFEKGWGKMVLLR